IVYAATSVALLYVLRGVDATVGAAAADAEASDGEGEPSAAVFAVDRRTGDVLAWPSWRAAVENAPLYGVEDEEYDWFLDDGAVLRAAAQGRDGSFPPTGAAR